MGNDIADVVGNALGRAAREAVQNASAGLRKQSRNGASGTTKLAAGVGLMALAPVAAKGVGKLVSGLTNNGDGLVKGAGAKLASAVKDVAPGGGDSDGKSKGLPGVGKGRRMPVQQDIDIGMPIKTVYNQWTQFEEWPKFMHRLQQVSQDDETHVSFKTKVWGISKEFKAEIVEQQPDEMIKWHVAEGVTHAGVVTFHELGPRLTRVEVSLDVDPGSLLEKAARGMRHVKRAVRADLARFKAYVLMEGEETGAWRGSVEERKVKRSTRGSRASSGRSRSPSSGRTRSSANGRKRSSSVASGSGAKRTRGSA